MGIFDKPPFSWRGDYEEYYKSSDEKALSVADDLKNNSAQKTNALSIIKRTQEHRVLLQEYSKKLKEKGFNNKKEEQEILLKIKAGTQELKNYSGAVCDLEHRVADYVKRLSRKEPSLFEEIANEKKPSP